MLEYVIEESLVFFYHREDLADTDAVVTLDQIGFDSKGKFIKLTDGSDLYVKIMRIYNTLVFTSGTVFDIKDIILQSKAKRYKSAYSGVLYKEESFQVRKATPMEKRSANQIINGKKPKKRSLRVAGLTLKQLQEQVGFESVNAKYAVDRLKSWADGNGQHALKALERLLALQGIDISSPERMLETKQDGFASIDDDMEEVDYQDVKDQSSVPQLKEIETILESLDD